MTIMFAAVHESGSGTNILVSGDREVIAGHGRLAASKLLSLASVPVVVLGDTWAL
jgi:ParB-like chromosome segregation protein Spo0J